jgi:serine/threonine-protein kinase
LAPASIDAAEASAAHDRLLALSPKAKGTRLRRSAWAAGGAVIALLAVAVPVTRLARGKTAMAAVPLAVAAPISTLGERSATPGDGDGTEPALREALVENPAREGVPTVSVDALPRVRGKLAPKPLKAAPGAQAPAGEPSEGADEAPSRIGQLTVVCYPACDDVLIDGKSVGPSPIFKQTVSKGTHRVKLRTLEPEAMKVVDVSVSGEDPVVLRQSMAAPL